MSIYVGIDMYFILVPFYFYMKGENMFDGPLSNRTVYVNKQQMFVGINGNRYNSRFYNVVEVDGVSFICRRATDKERQRGGNEFYKEFRGYFPVTELDSYE